MSLRCVRYTFRFITVITDSWRFVLYIVAAILVSAIRMYVVLPLHATGRRDQFVAPLRLARYHHRASS